MKWLLTTNKGCISGTGKMLDIRSFLLLGFPKGQAFGTRLCLQSVMYYTLYALSALLRKWAFHRERQGHLQQPESGAVFVTDEAANAGVIASTDRACVKSPVLRHPAHIGAICPEVPCLWSWVPEVEQQLMNSKWKCGKPLSGFPALITHQQNQAWLSTAGAFMRPFILSVD